MRSELSMMVASPRAAEVARSMGPGRRLGVSVGADEGATIRTTATGVAVDPGVADAPVVVALADDAFAALVAEEHSIFGLLYGGRLTVVEGDFARFATWEPALQALLYDRPLYDTEAARPFRQADLARSFATDDDPVARARFLAEHGYLHVRGVFSTDEVAVLSDEVDRLRAEATPTDGTS